MSVAVRVIPCLDVAGGRVVKGVHFRHLRDAGDPVERARHYFEQGADEITFLDVAATVDDRSTMFDVVTATARDVFVPLTVGGGVRSVDDVARLLGSGADKVSVNSAAIERPELIAEIADRFGSQVLVLSLDVMRCSPGADGVSVGVEDTELAVGDCAGQAPPSGFTVTTHGGRRQTGRDAIEWAREAIDLGVGELLINSIDADGTKAGFDTELIRRMRAESSVPVVASGGAGSAQDFFPAVEAGADAVLAASIFHSGDVTIGDVKEDLRTHGVVVRR